jgi:hypothetical protein
MNFLEKNLLKNAAHEEAMQRLCMICGELLTGRVNYFVYKYIDKIKTFFNLQELVLIENVHPKGFCNKCYSAISIYSVKNEAGKPFHHSKTFVDWRPHPLIIWNVVGTHLFSKKNFFIVLLQLLLLMHKNHPPF